MFFHIVFLIKKEYDKLYNVSCGKIMCMVGSVTPQTRGSVNYPLTRGIQVDVGLPDATSENWVESPLYGELHPTKTPA